MKYDVIAGLDIGNGYVKGQVSVNGFLELIDMPSVVSYTVGVDIPQNPTETSMSVSNLVNDLDATVTSRLVSSVDSGRVLFGRRAILSGGSQREFNIEDTTPKCSDALSTMLVLGSLAASVLSNYYNEHKTLPKEVLEIDAMLGVALPIEDYMAYKDVYRNQLMSDTHQVIIQNFETSVTVSVRFKDVVVLAEGAAAQHAIRRLGADFLQLALDDAREHGAEIDKEYTGEMLAGATNTIGIDIGEGTVNFPVFVSDAMAIESSSSIKKGYGTVLTNVVSELRNTNYAFESRKDLAEFMLKKETMPSKRNLQELVQRHIDEQVRIFVMDIMKEYSNVFRKVGMRTDVIYIYGGGSGNVHNVLYPRILEASTMFSGNCVPVIYLDAVYSRDLNRKGLFEVAKDLANYQ